MNNIGHGNSNIDLGTIPLRDSSSSPKSGASSRGEVPAAVSRTASDLLDTAQSRCIPTPVPAQAAQPAIASSKQLADKFSPENIHAMLEINMAIEPPLDSRTFNSFMPALALAASTVPTKEKPAMLAGTLKLFGEQPGSGRAEKLENALNAFPMETLNGKKLGWSVFDDLMHDPLDKLKVYESIPRN